MASATGLALDKLLTGTETVVLGRKTFEQYAASVAGLEQARKLVIASRPVSRTRTPKYCRVTRAGC